MPFADDRTTGQRRYLIPSQALDRARLIWRGREYRFDRIRDGAPAVGPDGDSPFSVRRAVTDGGLEITLGAAAGKCVEDLPRNQRDDAIAAATIAADVFGHAVQEGQPPGFVFSHHLGLVLGEDPDELSERYKSVVGRSGAHIREAVGQVEAPRVRAGRGQSELTPRTSRRLSWLRDERILALTLYFQEGVNASAASVRELSEVLRGIPMERELAADPGFRSPASVATKLANFLALDPSAPGGLTHGSRGDQEVWNEFSSDLPRLQKTAAAIRATLTAGPTSSDELDLEDFETAEAPEGAVLTREHRVRERNRTLAARKKADVLAREGKLECGCCGFDFGVRYGELGGGFIECHHRRPVSDLRPNEVTRLTDLALVCPNCHRMLHRQRPWLTIDELRDVIARTATAP
jgi:5-methylcytosine-specific restriction protein A